MNDGVDYKALALMYKRRLRGGVGGGLGGLVGGSAEEKVQKSIGDVINKMEMLDELKILDRIIKCCNENTTPQHDSMKNYIAEIIKLRYDFRVKDEEYKNLQKNTQQRLQELYNLCCDILTGGATNESKTAEQESNPFEKEFKKLTECCLKQKGIKTRTINDAAEFKKEKAQLEEQIQSIKDQRKQYIEAMKLAFKTAIDKCCGTQ